MNTHNKKFEICTNELNSSSYTKTDFTCFNAEHSFEESPKINMNTKEENICFNLIGINLIIMYSIIMMMIYISLIQLFQLIFKANFTTFIIFIKFYHHIYDKNIYNLLDY